MIIFLTLNILRLLKLLVLRSGLLFGSKNFIFSLLLFSTFSHSQDLEFENINSNHGLSHSTVYSITEDEHGFLWFGTREGLNRYDGYKITTFYRSESPGDSLRLKGNEINSLLAYGTEIFIGTQKGLSKYSQESDSFISDFSGKEINDPIKVLYQQDDGKIFAGTTEGLYLIKENNLKEVICNINVRGIHTAGKDQYWLALNKEVILINSTGEEIKNYRIQRNEHANRNMRINTLYGDSKGNIWLGTSIGLYAYDEKEDQFILNNPLSDKNHKIEAKVIRTIAEDKDKNLWLGTEDGIFIYNSDKKKYTQYTHSFKADRNSLSHKSILMNLLRSIILYPRDLALRNLKAEVLTPIL